MEKQRDVLISELDLNDEDIIRVSRVIGAAFNDIPNAEVKWKEFGMKLLLKDDENVLGDIKKVCTEGFADRCQRLLDYWKSVKASEGEGWNRVSEALRAVGLTRPADKLEKDLKSLKQKTPEQPSQYEPGKAYEDRKERKIPKENLLYTVEDLKTEVEDLLHKFHENTLDIQRDKKTIDDILLLLMVVNTSEFYAAMYYFSKNEVMVLKSGSNVYYIGMWGKIPAALIQQSKQGVTGPVGSQQVTCSSIKLFENLKVIIALGVCGTMGQLGEVIVSSRIDEYNIKAKGSKFLCRGEKHPPGENIYSFLKQIHEIWSFQCTKPATEVYNSSAVFKPMLSGTPLVASGEYRNKLIDSLSPEAGGVEMEGIGVIHGIGIEKKKDQIEFIIVKAGCDYADESKNKEWQPVAAMAAADFVYTQFEKKKVLRDWILGGPSTQATEKPAKKKQPKKKKQPGRKPPTRKQPTRKAPTHGKQDGPPVPKKAKRTA